MNESEACMCLRNRDQFSRLLRVGTRIRIISWCFLGKDYSDDALFCYTFRLKPRPHNLTIPGSFGRGIQPGSSQRCDRSKQMLKYKKGAKSSYYSLTIPLLLLYFPIAQP